MTFRLDGNMKTTYKPMVKHYQELTLNEKINAKQRFWKNSTRGKAIVKNPLIAY